MALFPLRDDNPTEITPLVTWSLIGLNVAVFLYQLSLPERAGEAFVYSFGAIPAVVFGEARLPDALSAIPGWATLISSMFLHGGLLHLGGNMLYLWIFGNNVEDAMGHGRFVAFYLICGIAAALAHAVTDPSSEIPMVGASGAISGVLGAYLILHPKARVYVLVFLWIGLWLPAWTVLALWFVGQGISAFGAEAGAGAGVAWWAHIGGFVAGMALVFPFRRRGVALMDPGQPAPLNPARAARGPWGEAGPWHGGQRSRRGPWG